MFGATEKIGLTFPSSVCVEIVRFGELKSCPASAWLFVLVGLFHVPLTDLLTPETAAAGLLVATLLLALNCCTWATSCKSTEAVMS